MKKGNASPSLSPKTRMDLGQKAKGPRRLGPIHRRRARVSIITMMVIGKGIAHYNWKN